MARRDGKKKKESDHFQLIDLGEVKAREQKFATRLQDIRAHAVYTDEAMKQYERMENQRLAEEHWQRYVRCDGMPRPDSPPEIRTFIARQRHFQQIDNDNTVDWQLAVNERSLLTQDISRIDATRKTTRANKCPDIGGRMNRFINDYLTALKDIDLFLENDFELCHINLNKAYEIIMLRIELEQEVFDTLDRLTYRVIADDSAYMSTTNGLVETYSHAGCAFRLDIWALTDAPVRFEELDLPVMDADLILCQVNIQIPLSVLSARMTLECLHTDFDYYSPKAKSFEHVVAVPTDHLNAGIPDMESCLLNEWQWQNEIQEEMRQKMLSHYEHYVDATRVFEETLKEKSKEKSENTKLPKPPKEPQFLPENKFPDPTNFFLEREENQWRDFLDEYFHPDFCDLGPTEINLRQCLILGGIYTINFVHRPSHYDINDFNTTSHDKQRKLHVYKDLVADTKVFDSESEEEEEDGELTGRRTRTQSEMRMRFEKSRTHITATQDVDLAQYKTDFAELPYFFLTFKLERNLCLWGEPTVCQFVESELEVPLTRQTLHFDMLAQFRERVGTEGQFDSETNEGGPPVDGGHVIRTSVATLRQSAGDETLERNQNAHMRLKSVNVFRSKFSSLLRNFDMPEYLLPSVPVGNFPLSGILTNKQVRTLTEHCVPRILPSFTFPMEARDEINRLSEMKAKKGLMLLRKRDEDEDNHDETAFKSIFSYEGQTNPEYVFPVFDTVHGINYGDIEFMDTTEEPQSFHELVHILDDIKKKYLSHYRQVVYQTEFEPRPLMSNPPKLKALQSPSNSIQKFETKPSLTKITGPKTKARLSQDRHNAENNEQLLDREVELTNFEQFNVEAKHSTTKSEIPTKITTFKRWTTEFIKNSIYNKEQFTMTVQTDRLGIFGFAFNRYEHFPFRNWKLHPNPEQEGEVLFMLDTQHVRLVLYISNKGYRGYVTDLKKEFVLRPVKYVNIEEPLDDFNELKKRLIEKNVCVFAENDASFYIKKGLFSQKHLATEHHIYDAMALHCMLLKFDHSLWNRLASRRNIVINMKGKRDDDDSLMLRITPEQTTFVDISELCSNDIDEYNLEYTPTWRNISPFTDLNNAICSIYSHAFEHRNKDVALVSNLWKLLHAIKPLSFS